MPLILLMTYRLDVAGVLVMMTVLMLTDRWFVVFVDKLVVFHLLHSCEQNNRELRKLRHQPRMDMVYLDQLNKEKRMLNLTPACVVID